MTRRGLTLMELLMALVLLSALTATISAWVNVTAALSISVHEELAWRQAAEAALRTIEDDLAAGDVLPSDTSRVHADEERLTIISRAAGSGKVTHTYEVDGETGWLQRVRVDAEENKHARRLLDSVKRIECEFLIDEQDDSAMLSVAIISPGGNAVTRGFKVP